MATEAGHDDPDEWELINDDGFVYKRKKRPRLELAIPAPPPPDPSVERRHRRERRKRALLKLRERYMEEISRWELLSNTLTATEEKSRTQELHPTTLFDETSTSAQPSVEESSPTRLFNDLLCQVEVQDIIIRDISNLCDVAEGLFKAEEERLRQQLTDLPIWDPSPHELMAALGDE